MNDYLTIYLVMIPISTFLFQTLAYVFEAEDADAPSSLVALAIFGVLWPIFLTLLTLSFIGIIILRIFRGAAKALARQIRKLFRME